MSRQLLLDVYFKSKSSIPISPSTMKTNKRRLSLRKSVTPSKSRKVATLDKNFINLCSDDDEDYRGKVEPEEDRISSVSVLNDVKSKEDRMSSASNPNNVKSEVKEIGSHSDLSNVTVEKDGMNSVSDLNAVKSEVLDKSSDSDLNNVTAEDRVSFVTDFNMKAEVTGMISVSDQSDISTSEIKSELDDGQDSALAGLFHDIDEVCNSPKKDLGSPRNNTDGNDSDSSQNTVIYFPSPKTPSKTQTPSTSQFRSPQSGNKYYSPNKKRAVYKKTSIRRNLNDQLNKENDELFNNACLGLDDKTIFLLSDINKCMNNPSLRCLLDEESQNLLSRYMQVVKPGMRLVCRLYWHKEGWYKIEKLRLILSGKESIDDSTLHEVLRSLVDNGFLSSSDHKLTFEEYTTLLSAEELKEICKHLKIKINSKQGAIAALKNFSREKSIATFFTPNQSNNNSTRVLKLMSVKAGPCYKLSELARRTLYNLYILMYLGINYDIIKEKNLELTLLYDKINRETYPVEEEMLDDASVVFTSKDEFQSYITAINIHEAFLDEADVDKKIKIVKETLEMYKQINDSEMLRQKSAPEWLRRFTPVHWYIKTLEAGIQYLKKVMNYPLALQILKLLILQDAFRQHKKAEWYAEKALLLNKIDLKEDAAKVLLEGFKSDLSEEAKDVMRTRAKIIAKHIANPEMKAELLDYASKEHILEENLRGVPMYKQPMDRTQQKGKLKFETRSSGERTVQDVEEYCLSEYLSRGEFTNGMHWEGRIITTIFFLLFWDIIYWKPPNCLGVFLTRFQKYPLDLYSKSFYTNRKDAIEARLSLIQGCSVDVVIRIMESKWCMRPETERSGINRESISWEQVSGVAACLGGGALAALCGRLARHFAHAHCGFPDLTLWNTRTKQIRFVEVKSDTDKPSLNQIQWMHFLQQNGIDTEFCYVGVRNRVKAKQAS